MDFFTSIPTHIDYVGQAKAEKLYRAIITLFSIVGFIWGYIVQQFSQSVYILGAGFLLAAILTVPPWPMYRRNPLNWQNPKNTEEKPSGKKGKKQ
ncbi:Signal peptidase complex subunit 1 [Papilio machaon]|uniref:Signal peptidase complex subunit 1 n=2 Tax=Papilionoidea TaxID=37572 RepID=A0A0N1IPQ6_PAPMA|nr:signal peptidase complex subunit 1 [Papilio machaon]KPJ15659.1 Signal peptidase complex subunit 1 [Papilio machaon]